MAQSTLPFPYIKSLPPADQARLKRDFDWVMTQINTTRVFDAYVDSEATADNPTTRTFKTPFAAILYVRETLGKFWVNIGWFKPSNTSNVVTATETGNYAGTNTCYVTIDVIGADEVGGSRPAGNQVGGANWDLVSFTDSGKFARVHLRNIYMNSNLTGGTFPFQNAAAQITATNCYFQMGGARLTNGSAISAFWNCGFNGTGWGGTSQSYLDTCFVTGAGGETITQSLITRDCRFSNFGPTLTGTDYIFANASFQNYASGAGGINGCSLLFNNAATSRVYISSVGEDIALDQGVAVTISAAVTYVWIEGHLRSLVLAAPLLGSAAGSWHHVHARCETTFDITGPANLDVISGTSGNFLRGANLTGAVSVSGDKAAGQIGVQFVGVTDSVLLLGLEAYGTAGTGKGYTIDAASARNTIITAGDGLFPTASTNSSTTTITVTYSSTFPINGRDSTGDALNKDMVPAWLGGDAAGVFTIPAPTTAGAAVDLRDFEHEWIAELATGVTTIPAPAPGSAPTGPAGGSLNGTYPNPSFLGRDSSVDKLNQDMLPALLAPPQGFTLWGVNAGPYGSSTTSAVFTLDQNGRIISAGNASIVLPETAADLDLRRKDLDPAVLVPGSGIFAFPPAEIAADVDARRKDLVPMLLGPQPGMTVSNLVTDLAARTQLGLVVAISNGLFVP